MPQYTLPDWARHQQQLLAGPNNPAINGLNAPHTSDSGGNYNDFLAQPGWYDGGLGKYANRPLGGGPNDGMSGADYEGFNEMLRSTGQSLYEGGGNNESARWMQDAQGNITSEPQITSLDDDNFWTAALLAAAVTGANLYSAQAGGGSLANASGGATSFPVSPGTVTSAQLGSGVVESAVGAGAGTMNSGRTAIDPIANYLTTGASEGSTVGNWLTGAGGQSGAVGAGSSASWLSSLGSSASDLFSKGGVKSMFDIASGIYGLNLASDVRKASDPFSPYRGAYAEQLGQLEANPGGIVNRPGFQAGLLAIDRSAAAKGYTGSGNAISSLQRFGGDFYNQEAQRLAGLAGAGQAPGAGQFEAAKLANLAVSSFGYGLAPYTNGARGPK